MKAKKKLVTCNVGLRVPEATAFKVDELVKGGATLIRKASLATSPVIEGNQRTETSVITTGVMDRDFEIVDPAGIDLTDYNLNPVVLFGHDQDKTVGKCLWIKPGDSGLIAKTYYPTRPKTYEGEWLPDFVFSMIQADVLRAKSIGFLALEWRGPEEEELALYPELQKVITRSLLLEYSVVGVPSNPLALIQTIEKGKGLNHWSFKTVGKIKPKKPDLLRNFAEQLNAVGMNADDIAREAVEKVLSRWGV